MLSDSAVVRPTVQFLEGASTQHDDKRQYTDDEEQDMKWSRLSEQAAREGLAWLRERYRERGEVAPF